MLVLNKIISLSLLSSISFATKAPENFDSSKKSVARAHLDNNSIKGMIEFTSKKGVVNVHLDVTGLPQNSGPFQYFIHDSQVPLNGDCKQTGSILNPYNSNYEICDEFDDDSLCAIGDLSGKHGFINTTCFETKYSDPYLSLNPNNVAFVGDMSLIITDKENNKISCSNIKMKRYSKLSRDEFFENDYLQSNIISQPNIKNNTLNSTNSAFENNGILSYDPLFKNITSNSTKFGLENIEGSKLVSGSNMLYFSSYMVILFGGLSVLL